VRKVPILATTIIKSDSKAGSREAGQQALDDLAQRLLEIFPMPERAAIIKEIAYLHPDQSFGAGTRLAAVKYANDINGIVTVVDDKLAGRGDSSLPVIIIEDMPAVAAAKKLIGLAQTIPEQPKLTTGPALLRGPENG
jgi:hypothetical protein